jgi:hypothetical protein
MTINITPLINTEITFNRDSRDYDVVVVFVDDGHRKYIGSAATYHAAETVADTYILNQLQHAPAPTDEQLNEYSPTEQEWNNSTLPLGCHPVISADVWVEEQSIIDANPELAYPASQVDAPLEDSPVALGEYAIDLTASHDGATYTYDVKILCTSCAEKTPRLTLRSRPIAGTCDSCGFDVPYPGSAEPRIDLESIGNIVDERAFVCEICHETKVEAGFTPRDNDGNVCDACLEAEQKRAEQADRDYADLEESIWSNLGIDAESIIIDTRNITDQLLTIAPILADPSDEDYPGQDDGCNPDDGGPPKENTIRIPLVGTDKCALADAGDYSLLSQHKWYLHSAGYARCRGAEGAYMHRMIMDAPEGMQVDHINGDKLDNRRANLRLTDSAGNARNCSVKAKPVGTSQYKGVYFKKQAKKWTAKITVDYNEIHLGYFESELAAVQAYDKAAIKYFGEFARTNFSRACTACGGIHHIQQCPEVEQRLLAPSDTSRFPVHGHETGDDQPLFPAPTHDAIQAIAKELADAEEAAGNRAGLNAVNKAAFHLASGVEYRWALGDLLIASGTRTGTVHRVRLSSGGTWICSCEAAANGRGCWHIESAIILSMAQDRQAATQQLAA